MDMDVYYGLDDEYGTYMSDTEEPFDGHEDGYEGAARQGIHSSKVLLCWCGEIVFWIWIEIGN